MSDPFLVLECPRCGGRLSATTNPQLFTCRYCQFDVLLRDAEPAPKPESPTIEPDWTEGPPEWLLRHQARLEKLKAERENDRGMATGCGLGCLVNVAILVFFGWLGITSFSWIPVLGASLCFLLFIVAFHGMQAHRLEIKDLENRIARSTQRR